MKLYLRPVPIFRDMSAALGNVFSAFGKASVAWLRNATGAPPAPNWQTRAEMCELCHLRVVKCGVSYCGKPYLSRISREDAVDGCGCPCREKARTPGEHCPLDHRHQASVRANGTCTCKWCSIKAPLAVS